MEAYHNLLRTVLKEGKVVNNDRTGVGTLAYWGLNFRHDLSEGFPLITTKKVFWKGIVRELLWFISGDTNISYLVNNGVHIWDDWALERYEESMGKKCSMEAFLHNLSIKNPFAVNAAELGPIYGKQWRSWGEEGIDQLQKAIETIIENPTSRRMLVNSWNASEISDMKLPPCHFTYQFSTIGDRLNIAVVMRSADLFLGVPFNIASYALLNILVCHITGYKPGILYMTFHDAHIYSNHLEQVELQLSRDSKELPKVYIDPDVIVQDINDFKYEDIILESYNPHPAIKAPVAV